MCMHDYRVRSRSSSASMSSHARNIFLDPMLWSARGGNIFFHSLPNFDVNAPPRCRCGVKRPQTKTISFARLPDILILQVSFILFFFFKPGPSLCYTWRQLKRFYYQGHQSRKVPVCINVFCTVVSFRRLPEARTHVARSASWFLFRTRGYVSAPRGCLPPLRPTRMLLRP